MGQNHTRARERRGFLPRTPALAITGEQRRSLYEVCLPVKSWEAKSYLGLAYRELVYGRSLCDLEV